MINQHLEGEKIVENDAELARLLSTGTNGVKPFTDAISSFFTTFNGQNDTSFSLKTVLDIYSGEIDPDQKVNVLLCKALLDFIQTEGLKVTFKGRTSVLRFATLAQVNGNLESIDAGDQTEIIELSQAISSFINKIRSFFSDILPDGVDLSSADVSQHLVASPNNGRKLAVSLDSVRLTDSRVVNFKVDAETMQRTIKGLNNEELVALLDYIYERMPANLKRKAKHLSLARLIMKPYKPSHGQAFKRVLEEGGTIGHATIAQMGLGTIRQYCSKPVA